MYKSITTLIFGSTIVAAGALNNHLYNMNELLKPGCPTPSAIQRNLVGIYMEDNYNSKVLIDNYINQLQFDSNGNYFQFKFFYCPKGIPCPQTFVPVFPTKGHFAVQNIQCQQYGRGLSFDLEFTETVNSLNKTVNPAAQKPYIYRVKSATGLQFNRLLFSKQGEQKHILKLNDNCSPKVENHCDIVTKTKGAECFNNKCLFTETIDA